MRKYLVSLAVTGYLATGLRDEAIMLLLGTVLIGVAAAVRRLSV